MSISGPIWNLTAVFASLSFLSFGGGNALVPQMYADAVERYHWVSPTEFSRFFALARLAPGPTMNMSALIGYAVAGYPGAIVATAALFVPAALIVFFLGRAWHRLQGHPWRNRFAAAFAPVVLGLIWAGIPPIAKGAVNDVPTIALAVVAGLLLYFTRLNQAILILAAGAIGFFALRPL
jgi:chromate transporter